MRKDEKFLNAALKRADLTTGKGRFRIGAVIVEKGTKRIISTGRNIYINGTAGSLTIHAEQNAVYRAHPHRIKNSTIYIAGYRKRKNGSRKLLTSKACARCHTLLKKLGISQQVYYNSNGEICREQI